MPLSRVWLRETMCPVFLLTFSGWYSPSSYSWRLRSRRLVLLMGGIYRRELSSKCGRHHGVPEQIFILLSQARGDRATTALTAHFRRRWLWCWSLGHSEKFWKTMLVRMRNTMLLWKHSWWCALIKKPTEMTSAAHERTLLSGLVEFLGEDITFSFSLPNVKM